MCYLVVVFVFVVVCYCSCNVVCFLFVVDCRNIEEFIAVILLLFVCLLFL